MNPTTTYNTPLYLWKNYLASFPKDTLFITDGYIGSKDNGVIGCFPDQNDAITILQNAGYAITILDNGQVVAKG